MVWCRGRGLVLLVWCGVVGVVGGVGVVDVVAWLMWWRG